MTRRAAPALAILLTACGGRSQLDIPTSGAGAGADAGPVPTCAPLPPIPVEAPRPLGAACTFSPTGDTTPVLAAIAGQDLIAVTPQATTSPLFHFSAAPATILQRSVVSRGSFLGAAVVASNTTETTLDVELVLLRLDGTVLVQHRETLSPPNTDGGLTFRVIGNAAGTFAFGVSLGGVGKVWVTVADGRLLGPTDGVQLPYGGDSSPLVQPDARGRFLVLPLNANSTADIYWLDPCTGSMTAPRLPTNADGVAGWGSALFGITAPGQPSRETADGVSALGVPPIASAALWEFVAPGQAMVQVPPYPPGLSATANLVIVDAVSLKEHPVALAYPGGLSVVPPDGWLSAIGDSNNPAGFGVDSSGDVTMFLADPGGAIHLEVTQDGSDWTPIGAAVATDPVFQPSYTLGFAEAGGTYVIRGDAPGGGPSLQLVRPASNVAVPLLGPAQIAQDGGCVAALVSPTYLEIVNATTGALTPITLPGAMGQDAWTSTWIPGDDAVLPAPQ